MKFILKNMSFCHFHSWESQISFVKYFFFWEHISVMLTRLKWKPIRDEKTATNGDEISRLGWSKLLFWPAASEDRVTVIVIMLCAQLVTFCCEWNDAALCSLAFRGTSCSLSVMRLGVSASLSVSHKTCQHCFSWCSRCWWLLILVLHPPLLDYTRGSLEPPRSPVLQRPLLCSTFQLEPIFQSTSYGLGAVKCVQNNALTQDTLLQPHYHH